MGYLWFSSAALLVLQQAAVTQPVPRADYLKVMDAEFKQLDANGDGKVTAQEVTAKQTQDEKAQALALNRKIFTQLDKDGTVTLIEHRTVMLATFDAIDRDKDGVVTPAEMQASQQQKQQAPPPPAKR